MNRVEEMMKAMGQWILLESVATASSFSSACCLSQPASWPVSCPMDRNEAFMMGPLSKRLRRLDSLESTQ